MRACAVYIVCSTDRDEYPKNENDVKMMRGNEDDAQGNEKI